MDTWKTVTFNGELDMANSPGFQQQLDELIRAGHHHLLLDLEQVSFADSTGLAVLIHALRKLREKDGRLLLRGSNQVQNSLRATGLLWMFEVENCGDSPERLELE